MTPTPSTPEASNSTGKSAWSDDAPFLVACGLVLLFGLVLRAQSLGFPGAFSFDEHHFVENARNYLAGKPDWNDHPPLGKLFIAAGIELLGDKGVGWRAAALAFGVGNVLLGGLLARRLCRDERAFWLGAALFAGDGFLLAYSRTALLDGTLTFFCLATLACLTAPPRWSWLTLASVCVGLAASVKSSGGGLALLVVAAWLTQREVPRWGVVTVALAPLLYLSSFSLGLKLTGQPWGLASAYAASQKLLVHHLGLTEMKHWATSYWYTWFVPVKPLLLRRDPVDDGMLRVMTTLGNPLLWWAVTWVTLARAVGALRQAYGAVRLERWTAWRRIVTWRPSASQYVFASYLLMLLPWVVTARDSYIYHYLPSYAAGLVLVAMLLWELYRRRRRLGLLALLAVGSVSAFYAPVWAQLPVSPAAMRARLFIRSWR